MKELINKIRKLKDSDISIRVNEKINEFKEINSKDDKIWFSELCFCLLAANSKAKNSLKIQNELGIKGLLESSLDDVTKCIRRNNHRFHNTKAKFIVEARKLMPIKQKILQIINERDDPREFLVNNVKGFGYKEASHYLRNIGYPKYAILDRHILFLLKEAGLINEIKKSMTKNKYLEVEKEFMKICGNLKMDPGEVDLYMWYMMTGDLVK